MKSSVPCELSIGVETHAVGGPTVTKCGQPGNWVKTTVFTWEVAMCPEHAKCQPGKWHVVPHKGCVLR